MLPPIIFTAKKFLPKSSIVCTCVCSERRVFLPGNYTEFTMQLMIMEYLLVLDKSDNHDSSAMMVQVWCCWFWRQVTTKARPSCTHLHKDRCSTPKYGSLWFSERMWQTAVQHVTYLDLVKSCSTRGVYLKEYLSSCVKTLWSGSTASCVSGSLIIFTGGCSICGWKHKVLTDRYSLYLHGVRGQTGTPFIYRGCVDRQVLPSSTGSAWTPFIYKELFGWTGAHSIHRDLWIDRTCTHFIHRGLTDMYSLYSQAFDRHVLTLFTGVWHICTHFIHKGLWIDRKVLTLFTGGAWTTLLSFSTVTWCCPIITLVFPPSSLIVAWNKNHRFIQPTSLDNKG